MVQLHFQQDGNQLRWVYTDGLRTLGQRELAVPIPWSQDDPREKLFVDLLRFLEHYVKSQPERLLPGQTLRYGWSMLRFTPDEQQYSGAGPDVLLIEEQRHSFAFDDPAYVTGVARTLSLLQLQYDAMKRNHVSGDVDHPSPLQIVITCIRVNPEMTSHLRPLMAHRFQTPTSRESGWFLGCCDQDHDHDNPAELTTVHLHHLIKSFPAFFPYIAMPVGFQLLFEEHQAVIFHPNEQYGRPNPEPLLTSLPF